MLNLCIITGNLGQDPEIHYSSEGNPIASLNLAFKSGKDKTSWIKVTCFNKLAEISEQYLRKGAKVTIVGALDQEKWEKDGVTKTSFKIIANSIEFIKVNNSETEDVPF
jgi:single-strand DNA-binding protein